MLFHIPLTVSSHSLGLYVPPRRQVAFSATIPFSPTYFSASLGGNIKKSVKVFEGGESFYIFLAEKTKKKGDATHGKEYR
jgi:hypothetical protein